MKNTKESFKVVVYAGPTGGHLFPAQSFSERFKQKFPKSKILFVTSERGEKYAKNFPEGLFDKISYLPEFGFPGGLSIKNLKPFILFPFIAYQEAVFLSREKPDICVGFGSFASFAGMAVAAHMKIPTLIHEQNKSPGKATHWLLERVDAVCESFPQTLFKITPKKLRTVGLPIRAEVLKKLSEKKERREGEALRVLVVGGSQGARGLNRIAVKVFSRFSDEERKKIAVTHIAGETDFADISKAYQDINFPAAVYPFFSDMGSLFSKTDLAISRAGSATFFELAAFGIPAFVIPYPYAGGHQMLNAQDFQSRGAVLTHEENSEAEAWLLEHLRDLLADERKLKEFSTAMRREAKIHASEDLVNIACEMIEKNGTRKR